MHRILAKGNHSVKVHPDQLCISAGCGAILDNLFMCITEPNDGVLIPAPYYPAFDNDLRVRNGTVAIPVLGDDAASLPTPKQLDEAVAAAKADGRAVKALLLTNPSNPLGVVYGESLLDAIIWGLTNGMHVVVDEVYASSVFHETLEPDTGKPMNPFVSAMTLETMLSETEAVAQTKLHVVYGLSKDFCASGYRVGVLRTRNEGVLKAMDNVAYFCTLPGPMQHAVADMLEDREWYETLTFILIVDIWASFETDVVFNSYRVDGYLAENAANLKAQHDALTDALADAEIPVVNATAGMFVWVDLSRWMSESNWEEENRLWTAAFESAKIVMTPGKDCRHGTPGCFRLCFASVTREALTTAVGRLKELLAGY